MNCREVVYFVLMHVLMLILPRLFFTIGHLCTCSESKLTKAASLCKGAEYKLYRASFQAYRGEYMRKQIFSEAFPPCIRNGSINKTGF